MEMMRWETPGLLQNIDLVPVEQPAVGAQQVLDAKIPGFT